MDKYDGVGRLLLRASNWLSSVGDIVSYNVQYKPGIIRMGFYLYRKVQQNRVLWDCTVEQFAEFNRDTFMKCLNGFITPIAEKEFVSRILPKLTNFKEDSNERNP